MMILGIKYTHDSTVALIKDNKLIFSVENEKINNGSRYKKADSIEFAEEVLREYNLSLFNMDKIIIDGWMYNGNIKHLNIPVNQYFGYDSDLTSKEIFSNSSFPYKYGSYKHILGHIIGSYVTSDFAKIKDVAVSLVFDGSQAPRVDIVDPNSPLPVKYIGNCHVLSGGIYGIMAYYYGPYKEEDVISGKNELSPNNKLFSKYGIPGKIMSYIALGKIDKELKEKLFQIYEDIEKWAYHNGLQNLTHNYRALIEHNFMKEVLRENTNKNDADVLLTIHTFLEELLVGRLTRMVAPGMQLLFSGGCALNIKWNTALLESKHFSDIWIPPFTNDTGSALGMAACENALKNDVWELDWSVYSGPKLIINEPDKKWISEDMNPEELGEFMYNNQTECVVVLNGNAEIGPRALGHRSLMMSPLLEDNKEKLNKIKQRESFRPVAPIALKEDAYEAFNMVKNDKYMLYDHTVKDSWKEQIPAIVHIDNTARVQVIEKSDSNFVFRVLSSFKKHSGIGILCNTSANYSGKGFFPDIKSATEWALDNDVRYVFANNKMYYKR